MARPRGQKRGPTSEPVGELAAVEREVLEDDVCVVHVREREEERDGLVLQGERVQRAVPFRTPRAESARVQVQKVCRRKTKGLTVADEGAVEPGIGCVHAQSASVHGSDALPGGSQLTPALHSDEYFEVDAVLAVTPDCRASSGQLISLDGARLV